MSLSNLELTDELMALLYGHSLVDLAGKSTQTAATAISYLGNNEKKIVILVNDPDHAFLSEQQLSFLVKMLAACKLHIGDTAIINVAKGPVHMSELSSQLSPAYLLFLGVSPSSIGMTAGDSLFAVEPFENGQYLQAPALDALNNDSEEAKPLKSRLWSGLKQMFGI